MTENQKDEAPIGNTTHFFLLVTYVIVLNFVTGAIVRLMGLPFYLDTWATVLGVLIGGFWVGIIGGTAANMLFAMFQTSTIEFAWIMPQITVAFVVYMLGKKWFDIHKPRQVLKAGAIVSVFTSIVVLAITFALHGGMPTYDGTAGNYFYLLNLLGNETAAAVLTQIIAEFSDKILSVFVAAILLLETPKWLILSK